MSQLSNACCVCQGDDNGFVPLNNTVDYSTIEIAISKAGMLRARHFPDGYNGLFDGQDIVNIKFCPECGRRLNT